MTPTSPVYPDGLIAPIWVRKHSEMVPSVFVLFLRLFESNSPISPLEGKDEAAKEEERKQDADLAAEIGSRKKSCADRGIKLTAVLLASRKMLGVAGIELFFILLAKYVDANRAFADDPTLDSRLSFIRRQSSLDSRAALFVLSPVSAAELNDFVKSLQSALYDSAMEHYSAHSKRVRRKRNKHGHLSTNSISGAAELSGGPPLAAGTTPARPLRAVGWKVRYDYKLALFAEFRMEEEVARKHYEDCWTSLVEMFASTAILPPRTKRWAEAKVLADCIAFKLVKLYLYHSEPHLALQTFNHHVARFADMSRGWGIGEETFEFWSWLARQWRILAELVELALRAGYKLPVTNVPALSADTVREPVAGAAVASSFKPDTVLQHPGYYYYMAAKCTQERLDRFLAVVEKEEKQPGTMSKSPGFANEKKVEHYVIIIDLYTKSYELFKRYRTGQTQSRQTFFIAFCIAETYHASGQYEAAIRFFERIAKTYRREQWGSLLRSILSMWYDCARQLGEVDLVVKLLFEMLTLDVTADPEERTNLKEDLDGVLKNSSPTTPAEPLTINLPDHRSIFETSMVFWRHSVSVNEPAPFQLAVYAPPESLLARFTFTSLRIQFGQMTPITVIHAKDSDTHTLQRVNLGDFSVQDGRNTGTGPLTANLTWAAGTTKVFCGSLGSSIPGELKASTMTLVLKQGTWTIELPVGLSLDPSLLVAVPLRPKRWLTSFDGVGKSIAMHRADCSVAIVRPKPHLLQVRFDHRSPAFVGEKYPVLIEIFNEDKRDLEVVVDVLLQPTEDESVNRIVFDDQDSVALIKGVSFGTIQPGGTCSKRLYLLSSGSSGGRILDISIRSLAIVEEEDSATDPSETLATLVIPVQLPFKTKSEIAFHRFSGPLRSVMDLGLYDQADFDPRTQATVITNVINAGPWELEVEKAEWNAQEERSVRLTSSSMSPEETDGFPLSLPPNDAYAIISRFGIDVDVDEDYDDGLADPLPCPGDILIKWRRKRLDTWTMTHLPLPPLRPPTDRIIGIVLTPPSARLHQPFLVILRIQNRSSERTADLILQTEASDAFVVAGPKSSGLPTLLPASSIDVRFNLVPLMCGSCRLPTFKVFDRRRSGPPLAPTANDPAAETVTLERVQVIDEQMDVRSEDGTDLLLLVESSGAPGQLEQKKDGVTLLVLPAGFEIDPIVETLLGNNQIANVLLKGITYTLLLQPISCILAFFVFIPVMAQVFHPAVPLSIDIICLLLSILAALIETIDFVIVIVIVKVAQSRLSVATDNQFVLNWGPAVWMTLAATVCLWLGMIGISALTCGCCGLRSWRAQPKDFRDQEENI
ncbi:hypothetical protein FRB96_001122 [Tulasnella sp. 330]|nr:hypothetical protein FRB96_001122 [Tulasnella sp. 330]